MMDVMMNVMATFLVECHSYLLINHMATFLMNDMATFEMNPALFTV